MTRLLLGLLLLMGLNANAQEGSVGSDGIYQDMSWIYVGLFYQDFSYEEPGVMTEDGGNGGVEAEIGFNVFQSFSLSLYGSYWDGRLQYDGATFGGSPVTTMTRDYVSDIRTFAHYTFAPFVFSIGYGNRMWFNDLVISYRRRTEYKYIPIQVTFHAGEFYYMLEYDSWLEGLNTSHMEDTSTSRNKVELPQNTGSGLGLEVGWILGGSPMTRVFLRAHKWEVEASESAFDGVDNLVEPENETLAVTLGIGLIF